MPLPQVTMPRVEAWAKARELKYRIDEDGDVSAGFDDVLMIVHLEEGLLRTQGYWLGRFNPEEILARVQEAANELNSSVVIPKTLVVAERGLVIFEFAAFTGDGFTDEQLASLLDNAFTATFQVAEKLAAKIPELAPKKENS